MQRVEVFKFGIPYKSKGRTMKYLLPFKNFPQGVTSSLKNLVTPKLIHPLPIFDIFCHDPHIPFIESQKVTNGDPTVIYAKYVDEFYTLDLPGYLQTLDEIPSCSNSLRNDIHSLV